MPAAQRQTTPEEVVQALRGKLDLKDAKLRALDLSEPGALHSWSYPIELALEGRDGNLPRHAADKLLQRMQASKKLTNVWRMPATEMPLAVKIDRAKAARLGVAATDVAQTLQLAMGGMPIGEVNHQGRACQVILIQETPADDLLKLQVRGGDGQLVALGAVAAQRMENSVPVLERVNNYPAVRITARSDRPMGIS